MNTPKITIIECGTLDTEFEEKFGDYPSMFKKLLAPYGIKLNVCRLVRGDALPDPKSADGFLISGSRHGVYDPLPWIEPLKAFIRDCAAQKIRMVGICFGHQIMAEALGGKVIKSPKGWGLGPQNYKLTKRELPFGVPSETLTIQAIHQDQVIEKPADAEVFASSEFCEFAGLVYGGEDPYALSLQPHPEFDADFVGALLETRRGKAYPAEVADPAISQINAPLNRNEWGKWISEFFKS